MVKLKLFRNKTGQQADRLRLKNGETLTEGILRLTAEGWEIGDPNTLQEGTDETGKYFEVKA